MIEMTQGVSAALARAKSGAYAVLDALDAIERKGTLHASDRDKLSAMVGRLGEEAWHLENLMTEAIKQKT